MYTSINMILFIYIHSRGQRYVVPLNNTKPKKKTKVACWPIEYTDYDVSV